LEKGRSQLSHGAGRDMHSHKHQIFKRTPDSTLQHMCVLLMFTICKDLFTFHVVQLVNYNEIK